MAEEKKDTIFNSAKCLKFKINSLSSTLMNAVPTALDGLAQTAKNFKINETLNAAAGAIGDLATNAVQNFKDIASGKLPEIALSNLDDLTSSLFAKLDQEKIKQLNEFNELASILNNELGNFTSFLDDQISCVENDYLKTTEVAAMEGNIMNNISDNVKKLSNNQLRDFNLDTPEVNGQALQQQFADNISKQAMNAQQIISEQGKTFAQQAQSQVKAFDSLGDLEITPPDVSSITQNLV
jgi:flagellar biosynthesis/type III secretory pathway chaperone